MKAENNRGAFWPHVQALFYATEWTDVQPTGNWAVRVPLDQNREPYIVLELRGLIMGEERTFWRNEDDIRVTLVYNNES